MNNCIKYWSLVMLLLLVSCADSLLVTSGLTSPVIALVITLVATLAGWVWLVKTIHKDRDQIIACLNNTELNRANIQQKNFFGSLFTEALKKIEHSDSELVSTRQDQTILKTRLNSAIKKEMLKESALAHLTTGVLVFDAQHVLEFSNTAADAFLIPKSDQKEIGLDSSLSLSKTLFDDIVIPELGRLLTKTIQRKNATSCRRTEFEFTSNGTTNQYCAVATNLCDENQNALGTIVVIDNISDKNTEKTNHAEFVSSVAHELKTPMSGIKAYVEMLMDGDCEPDEAQELYGFINDQIDRLTRLVNSMLNLARIESGVVDIKRYDYELNDILKTAFDVISPTAAEKEITITAQLSDLYLPVHVDKDMLGQAIINLLSNAVKYTPNGHEVCLRSRMEETSAVIEIRDKGMGIPKNSLPHIFDRFYRVPENNRSAAGTGLGLSLVHFIVTNVHNGSISVQSEVNEGTCFTINIPLGHKEKKKTKPVETAVSI